MLALGVDIAQLSRMRKFTQYTAQQRRFPGAVRSDERRQLTAVDVYIHIAENFQITGMSGKIFDFGAAQFSAVITRSIMMIFSFKQNFYLT